MRPDVADGRDLAALPVNVWLVGQKVSMVQRKGRYVPASMRHPGKMLPELARRMIEAYTIPGDWILDPMSGIGTTGVEAVHLGRNYVGIELEQRFVALQQENLALARSQGTTGRATILQGDARCLDNGLPASAGGIPTQPIDAIITSPPYGDRLKPRQGPPSPMMRDLIRRGRMRADVIPAGYGIGSDNLGNLSDADYLREMRQVYVGCFSVLKPGGILAVAIRPGRNRQHLRPLHYETARLCMDVGFDWIDERIAVLGRLVAVAGQPVQQFNHALFLKRLATAHMREAGHPVSLEQVEYVLVFQKSFSRKTTPRSRKNGRQAVLVGSLPDRIGCSTD